MAVTIPGVEEDEFKTWPTIREVYQEANRLLGSTTAMRNICFRLNDGLLQAYAETAVYVDAPPENRKHALVGLGRRIWQELADSHYLSNYDIWTTNDIEYKETSGYEKRTYRYYGIRIDPRGLGTFLPKYAEPTAVKLALPPEPPSDKGPAVAEAHLTRWAELFLLAYPNGTEAQALESARGMFPGKSVARDRVRAALGPRKRGPKPEAAK